MPIRRALALSALAVATALAGDVTIPADAGKTRVLTLHQAIEMALRDNIDIQWHKTDLKLQDAQIRLAWGDFDPVFSLNSSYQFIRTPQNPSTITTADTAEQILLQQQFLAEETTAVNAQPTPVPLPSPGSSTAATTTAATPTIQPFIFQNEDYLNSASLDGKTPLGTTYKIGVQANHLRDTVLNLNEQFLPSNTFFAGITLDQPLLRNFGYDANLASVRIGRRNRAISYNNWTSRVIESVAQVMTAYFDMAFAQETMRLRRESMQADQSLAEANQTRMDVGLMTPIDIRQAEVEVSADKEDLLAAKNLLTARGADLKKLIYRDIEQDDGSALRPAGPVELAMPVLDHDTLLADAFRNRPDYATALQQVEIEDLRLKYYRNQLLPQIDLVATLGVNGLSTTSSGRSVSEAFGGQAPEYIFGVQGSFPLGNVQARANRDSSVRLKQEALLKLKQVELNLMTDVDTAIEAVRTNQQRVETARQTRKFAEEVVHMANRRLEEGQASTLDLLDNRRRLYEAQSGELGAIDDLNKSIVQLWVSNGTLLRQESIVPVDDDREGPKHRATH